MRALASHQCGPCSIPGPDVMYGLSSLMVVILTKRASHPVFRFSSCIKANIQLESTGIKCFKRSFFIRVIGGTYSLPKNIVGKHS